MYVFAFLDKYIQFLLNMEMSNSHLNVFFMYIVINYMCVCLLTSVPFLRKGYEFV